MADNETNDTEKKKYSVVDKRTDYDDVRPATDDAAEEAGEPTGDAKKTEDQARPETTEPSDAEPSDEAAPTEPDVDKAAEIKIQDAMRVAMNMIRERALIALGLVVSKDRQAEPDLEAVKTISNIFGTLADSFADDLGVEDFKEASQSLPPIAETLNTCFNMMQGQIIMHMGLVANPVTGLIVKDMQQTKLGIDFLAALIEQSKPLLDESLARPLDAMVSDLRINYVNQLNQKA